MPVTWRHHRHPIPSGGPPPPIVRRWVPGYYTAPNDTQMGAQPSNYGPSGIPNSGHRWATGPVANGVKALMVRYHWNELDDGAAFNWSRPDTEIAQCAGFPADTDGTVGVKLIMLIVTRTFTGYNVATPFTLSNVHITGSAGQFSCNAASHTITAGNTQVLGISGTFGGTGSLSGYNGSQRYLISATNGSTTFTLQALDGTALSTTAGIPTGLTFTVLDIENPLPLDLQAPTMYGETFTSGVNPGGWQTWRWSPTVLSRFNDLCVAIGARYDTNAFFGGIATQETATGSANGGSGADAYTADAFVAGLKAESNSISNACQHARHYAYTNFINGPFSGTYISQTKALEAIATTVQGNGGVWGGPDLVVEGGITTACYPTYNKVHNGTSPIAAKGATFCCIQPAEWNQDKAPATPSNPQTVSDLFDYGTGVARNYGNGVQTPPLNVDILVSDWHTAAGYNGQKFNPEWVAVLNANAIPFGTFTP